MNGGGGTFSEYLCVCGRHARLLFFVIDKTTFNLRGDAASFFVNLPICDSLYS